MDIRPLTEGPDELHPMRSLRKYEDQNELDCIGVKEGGIKLKSENNDFFLFVFLNSSTLLLLFYTLYTQYDELSLCRFCVFHFDAKVNILRRFLKFKKPMQAVAFFLISHQEALDITK